jgi:hypothetical protein
VLSSGIVSSLPSKFLIHSFIVAPDAITPIISVDWFTPLGVLVLVTILPDAKKLKLPVFAATKGSIFSSFFLHDTSNDISDSVIMVVYLIVCYTYFWVFRRPATKGYKIT